MCGHAIHGENHGFGNFILRILFFLQAAYYNLCCSVFMKFKMEIASVLRNARLILAHLQ